MWVRPTSLPTSSTFRDLRRCATTTAPAVHSGTLFLTTAWIPAPPTTLQRCTVSFLLATSATRTVRLGGPTSRGEPASVLVPPATTRITSLKIAQILRSASNNVQWLLTDCFTMGTTPLDTAQICAQQAPTETSPPSSASKCAILLPTHSR